MVERFLEQQPAICAALISPQVRKGGSSGDICTLTENDISTAEEMAKALKLLKEATNIMSEDSSPTLSVTAPLLAQLLHDTKASSAEDDAPLVQEIKVAIHEDLSKRYTSAQTKNTLLISSTLDPRFKALPFLSREEQQLIHGKVVTEAAALEKDVGPAAVGAENPDTTEEESPPAPKRASALVSLLGKTFTEVNVVPKTTSTKAEEELKKYLEAPPLSLAENPLKWWSSHEAAFPLLGKLAKRYLCIPGTSVAAERVFSTAGDIVTAQRSNLSPDHVDQLVFLQKNLKIVNDGDEPSSTA
ncbi:zinc finger BED domain-containing protein 1-like [Oryzias melastigma]|uniref:zinc finger BED domain-containing protein 1-like n=1 Tax=Oryzias melastigma TaxID=30732 RepID=UPI000CF7E595|nr:zinc finger BED domain-containing protein 1-like [Oryzias melastigma]